MAFPDGAMALVKGAAALILGAVACALLGSGMAALAIGSWIGIALIVLACGLSIVAFRCFRWARGNSHGVPSMFNRSPSTTKPGFFRLSGVTRSQVRGLGLSVSTIFLLFVAYVIVDAVRTIATMPPARAFFALMIAAGIAGLVWHKAAPRYLQSDVLATVRDSARSKQLPSRTVLATSAGMMLSTVLVGSVVTWFCICSAAVFGPVAFLWALWLYKHPLKRANFYSRLGVYWLRAWFG